MQTTVIGPGRDAAPRPAVLTMSYRAITPPGEHAVSTRGFSGRPPLTSPNDTTTSHGAFRREPIRPWLGVNLHALDGLDIAPVTRAVLAFVLPRLPISARRRRFRLRG